jgi:predicted nucleotidyltransferase
MKTIHTEDVFGSRGRVSVLRVLANVSVPLSIRQIAVQAGMSHASTAEALERLVNLGLVASTQAGRSRVHWLERRNVVVRELVLPAFSAEAGLGEAVARELATALPDDIYSVTLFGSRARGDDAEHSDFDVLVVEPDHATLELTLARLDCETTELRARLGASVSVLGYTIEQAQALIARGDNFMVGVVRDGVLLAGAPIETWGTKGEGT